MMNQHTNTMSRNYLLLSLFIVLLGDHIFGFGLSLMPGLSFKNLYLYFIIIYLVSSAAVQGQFLSTSFPRFYIVFVLLCVYGMASWAVSSIVLSNYRPLSHAMSLKNQLVDPLLFFSVTFFGCRSKQDARWLAKGIFLAFALMSVLVLMDFVNLPNLGIIEDRPDGRLEGVLDNSNGFASLLIFFLFAMGPRMVTRDRSLITIAGMLASFALILLTGSRGALAGLAGSAVVTTFFLRKRLDTKTVVRVGAVVLAVVVAIAVVTFILHPDMFLNRLDRSEAGTLAAASSGRTEFWTRGLMRMWEHPSSLAIGFGWDTFIYSWIYPDPHSQYLYIFYSTGAVGLGLYLWLMVCVFRNAARSLELAEPGDRPYLVAFLYGFVALLFSITFATIYTPWPFVWAYVGLMSKLAWLPSSPPAPEEAEGLVTGGGLRRGYEAAAHEGSRARS
jgi:O-antigen ligase